MITAKNDRDVPIFVPGFPSFEANEEREVSENDAETLSRCPDISISERNSEAVAAEGTTGTGRKRQKTTLELTQ